MQWNDVRVLESGGQCHLALEPASRYTRRQIGMQHLDHDAPPEPRVVREENARHPSTTELTLDGVGPAERNVQSLEEVCGEVHAVRLQTLTTRKHRPRNPTGTGGPTSRLAQARSALTVEDGYA